MNLQEPISFGRYFLIDKIAVGGMAEVFKAKSFSHGGFEKLLVIKRILQHLSDNDEFVEMFIDEAKISVELQHPNIVQIYDFGRIAENYFIAMECVEGKDVKGILRKLAERRVMLPMEYAVYIAHEMCKGLDYAHKRTDMQGTPLGIIHRDVSPSNILVSYSGEVKVADFGIAKVEGGIGTAMTRMGAFVGTPQYAAPEQFLGAPASDKADVYSLGAVMVFLMTGRPLVPKAHTMAAEDVYAKLETLMPPGIQRQSDTPEDCETMNRILAACMAMDPLQRCSVTDAARMLAVLADPNFSGTADDDVFRVTETIASPSVSSSTVLPPTVLPPTVVPTSDSDPVLEVELPWRGSPMSPSADATEAAGVGPVRSRRRRWPFVLLASVLLVVSAALGMFALAPEQLDGLPGRGGWPKVSDGGIVRQLAQRAARSVRSDMRVACPEAKGTQMEIEAVLDRDGTVRWARPVNRLSTQAWCVAIEMEGASAGSRLKSPYRVRLQVRP